MPQEIKTLGRRRADCCRTGLREGNNLLKLTLALRQGKPFAPKGVYRFNSHEESDQWWTQILTRK